MGMITFKRINRQYIVTVDGKPFVFDTVRKALQHIFKTRAIGEVNE